MRGKIDLEPWEISELTPWFKGGIYILENTNDWDELDLTIMNITPNQVIQMLERFGYKEIKHECNGRECSAWFYYCHPEHKDLCFFYSGRYDAMNISLTE